MRYLFILVAILIAFSTELYASNDYSGTWPTTHSSNSVSMRCEVNSSFNAFDSYIWGQYGEIWLRAVPASGAPMWSSSNFSVVQSSTLYPDIRLIDNENNEVGSQILYSPIIVRLSYNKDSTAFNFSQSFTLVYNGSETETKGEIPALEITKYTYYNDFDTDGYGDPEYSTQAHVQPPFYVLSKGDCNDLDPTIYEGATEICGDGIDQDCNGSDKACDECPIKVEGLSMTGTREVGSPVTFTMNAKNFCGDTINYRFSCHAGYGTDDYTNLKWKSMTSSEYQTSNVCTKTFDKAGKYVVVVWAKKQTSDSNLGVKMIGTAIEIYPSLEEPIFWY